MNIFDSIGKFKENFSTPKDAGRDYLVNIYEIRNIRRLRDWEIEIKREREIYKIGQARILGWAGWGWGGGGGEFQIEIINIKLKT